MDTEVCGLSFDVVCVSCAFRAEYECFQIELSKNYGLPEWREDIKSIMLKAGLQNVQITFLFVDTQVKSQCYTSFNNDGIV